MKRKLMIAWTAIAVFAALTISPGTAAAKNEPVLTYPTGEQLANGSKIRAVNVGAISLTGSGGTTTCATAALGGSIVKNNGTELEADISTASFSGSGEHERCTGPLEGRPAPSSTNGLPWCLRSTPELATDEFQIRGGACSKSAAPIRLAFNAPTVTIECVYERSAAIAGTFTTNSAEAALTAKGVEFSKVAGSFICGNVWKLDSTFNLETESGSPIYVSESPTLTDPPGTSMSAGSKVRARSVGSLKFTNASETTTLWECSSAEMTGTLAANGGGAIEATMESASFSGTGTEETCTYSQGNTLWTFNSATNGLPWCLRATSGMASDEFQIRGNDCAKASRPIRLVLETTAITPICLYERQAAIAGTYTTHPEDAVLHFSNANFLEVEPRKAGCVDETTVDASLTLERDEAGTKPMYIS